MADPMIVRLATGEELIGYIQPDNNITWVKDPAIMVFDKEGLRLYDFLPYATLEEKGLPIKNERIDWVVEPELNLAVNYAKWHFDVIENKGKEVQDTTIEFSDGEVIPVDVDESTEGSGLKLVEP